MCSVWQPPNVFCSGSCSIDVVVLFVVVVIISCGDIVVVLLKVQNSVKQKVCDAMQKRHARSATAQERRLPSWELLSSLRISEARSPKPSFWNKMVDRHTEVEPVEPVAMLLAMLFTEDCQWRKFMMRKCSLRHTSSSAIAQKLQRRPI